jgi:aminopeptidase-like protein
MNKNINKYYKLAKNILFPICRSITGQGIKKTLSIIKRQFPKLKIVKIKAGTKVFDWKVPPEWNIFDAYIVDENNKKIIDFKKNNLHLVGYSIPVRKTVTQTELLQHLYTLPKNPKAIPYVTSYYKKYWGFCVNYNDYNFIKKNYKKTSKFRVIINSSFKNNGSLTYGELILKGKSDQEILISTYICHPSMANNELSGPVVSMLLIEKFLRAKLLKKTLRFIFIPETIGSISFLNKNLQQLKNKIIGGYNLSCIGDNKNHSCMLTKYGNTLSDKALLEAYKILRIKYKKYSFLERGSDERQYNSPGVDLPIASIFRTKYGKYKEYHTSLDNFNLVTKEGLKGGYVVAKKAIDILLKKTIPKNLVVCEPQMSKRYLYPTLSIFKRNYKIANIMNFLQYSDGKNDLKDISKIIKLSLKKVLDIFKLLKKKKLVID